MLKRIIYTVSLVGLSLLGWINPSYAQTGSPIVIEPLRINPRLAEGTHTAKIMVGNKYYFYDDTLSLPFMDDFSKDKFKDFRLSQYTGLYADTLHWFRMVNYTEPYPDSIWYVLTKPDTFIVTSPDTFASQPSSAPQFKIYLYDTLVNPYAVIDSIIGWKFIPKMIDVVNGTPVYSENFVPEGKLYNFERIYTIVPASPTDKSLWIDRNVYVNDGIAVKPPTIGVAVFDGINSRGIPYNHTPGARGVADHLTSKPIDLSGKLPGDSLYLSFYIQPQGLGFYPEPKDTFVLEFKTPDNPNWQWVWSIKGSSLKPFKHIMIPLTKPEWFVKGFQFRFKNYANLDANADHWLLDYVRLDQNRTKTDTLFDDVAFVTRAPSILREYEQMPAQQFTQPKVNQKWAMESANLSNACKWITYGHTTFDENGNAITSYPMDDNPGSYDTSCVNTYYPGEVYNNNFRHSLPSFSYVFDVQDPNCCPYQDSISFTVRHVIKNLTAGPGTGVLTYDKNTGNDTVYHHQTFYNFYAYDDSEAEASMYLGTSGQIAYEFELTFPDTLRAIQFYFNPQNPNVANNSFDLRVWQTLNNTAEDTLYSQPNVHPIYNDATPNGYTTYILTKPVALPAGKFYIGWRQNAYFRMNVGYDKNVDRSDKMYYKTTGQWLSFGALLSTDYDGAMMMRPVLGKPVTSGEFLHVDEPKITASVTIFPNPSGGVFYYELNIDLPNDLEIQVVDLSGKTVYTQRSTTAKMLDVSHLNNGIYFTRFISKSTSLTSVHKLIISK